MNIVLLAALLVLSATFMVSGIAKLADRDGSRQAMVGFGVPSVFAAPFAILLPLAEVAVAFALLPAVSAWWGALGLLGLLILFMVATGINLALGRKPDCHCFGKLYSAAIGWPTLVRTGALAAIAGFLVWQGPNNVSSSALSRVVGLTVIEGLGLGIALLALGLVLTEGVLGLPVGTPAPAFQLPGLDGETLTLDALRATGNPVMLIFSDPGCGQCDTLLPDMASWQRDYISRLTVALISRGTAEMNRAPSKEHGLTNVLLQHDHEVAESFRSNRTPSAVLIGPDGSIASPLAAGADAIRNLIAQTAGVPTSSQPPGERAA